MFSFSPKRSNFVKIKMNLRNFAAITTSIIKLGYSGLIFFLICPDHCEVCSCSKHPEQRDEFSFYLLKIKYSLQTSLGFLVFFCWKDTLLYTKSNPQKTITNEYTGSFFANNYLFSFFSSFHTSSMCHSRTAGWSVLLQNKISWEGFKSKSLFYCGQERMKGIMLRAIA